jgi:hypothetical protein
MLVQHWPAVFELSSIGQDVVHPDYVGQTSICLQQSRLNVLQTLLGLLEKIVRDGHGGVVVAGGAGDKDPIALHHRAAIANSASKD